MHVNDCECNGGREKAFSFMHVHGPCRYMCGRACTRVAVHEHPLTRPPAVTPLVGDCGESGRERSTQVVSTTEVSVEVSAKSAVDVVPEHRTSAKAFDEYLVHSVHVAWPRDANMLVA